jgi:RND family efflux transporter MFP subunit
MRLFQCTLVLAALMTSLPPAQAKDTAKDGTKGISCIVMANATTEISTGVPGVIEAIHANLGDRVQAGDPLFDMTSEVEQLDYEIFRLEAENSKLVEAARAQFELAQRAANRFLSLSEQNASAVNDVRMEQALSEAQLAEFNLLDALAKQERAQLEAKRARAILDQRRIHSPIAGVVVERMLDPGSYGAAHSPVLSIASLDPLIVEAHLPASAYGTLALGMVATVAVSVPEDRQINAPITMIDPVIDAGSGTFRLRLELSNPSYTLPAGMRCLLTLPEG